MRCTSSQTITPKDREVVWRPGRKLVSRGERLGGKVCLLVVCRIPSPPNVNIKEERCCNRCAWQQPASVLANQEDLQCQSLPAWLRRGCKLPCMPHLRPPPLVQVQTERQGRAAVSTTHLQAGSPDLRDLAVLDLSKLALADSIPVEDQTLGLALSVLLVERQQQPLHGSLHVLHTPSPTVIPWPGCTGGKHSQ